MSQSQHSRNNGSSNIKRFAQRHVAADRDVLRCKLAAVTRLRLLCVDDACVQLHENRLRRYAAAKRLERRALDGDWSYEQYVHYRTLYGRRRQGRIGRASLMWVLFEGGAGRCEVAAGQLRTDDAEWAIEMDGNGGGALLWKIVEACGNVCDLLWSLRIVDGEMV